MKVRTHTLIDFALRKPKMTNGRRLYEAKEAELATIEWKEKCGSTPSSPDHSDSAIAMMPPGQTLPASEHERVLGIKIARAMASGPRDITRDATVAEMGADGNLIILRKGTNDWVCFPGDENVIGNVPMCADPMGLHRECYTRRQRTCTPWSEVRAR